MAPLRCQGLIISLGVAALVLIGACDGKRTESIDEPVILTVSWSSNLSPSHVGVRISVHASSSNGPHESLLASTIEAACLSSASQFCWHVPISPLL